MLVRELQLVYRPRPDLPTSDGPHRLGVPRDAAAFLMPIIQHEACEVFGILCLTTKHELICWHEVARGSLDTCIVHPREVFKAALLANAACLIGAHNHPSGDPNPSPDDLVLTRNLVAAGIVLGVPFVDHIVIGNGRYFSFKETGGL